MTDEADDLDPEALTETLASCIEQLHHVRARVVLLDDGSPASEDDAALLRVLDGVETLLRHVAASMATRH